MVNSARSVSVETVIDGLIGSRFSVVVRDRSVSLYIVLQGFERCCDFCWVRGADTGKDTNVETGEGMILWDFRRV